jgi:uncharacterized protein (TIGR03083 family)
LTGTIHQILDGDWRTEIAIPNCPGWTTQELLYHLIDIQDWVGRCVASGDPALPGFVRHDREVNWKATMRSTSAALLSAFERTDFAAIRPSHLGPQACSWWLRRQLIEHSLHLWDLQIAHGESGSIQKGVAELGIDEWFEIQPLRDSWKPGALVDKTVHLHATDCDGEWLARFTAAGISYDRVHAKGDLAVRAPVADLLLALWGRARYQQFEVFGATELLAPLFEI